MPTPALHLACQRGDLARARELVSQGASVTAADDNGLQPLHNACVGGSLECARWLVSQGASVTAATNDGVQPLHHACANGHLECAQWLASQGASVTAAMNDGRSSTFSLASISASLCFPLGRRGGKVGHAERSAGFGAVRSTRQAAERSKGIQVVYSY